MDVRPACGRRAAVHILSFPWAVLSHMGKNYGNHDLVSEKKVAHPHVYEICRKNGRQVS